MEATATAPAIEPVTKAFKVVALSNNTNSFGLRQHILMAQDGEVWKAAANSLNTRRMGDVLIVTMTDTASPNWAPFGFEIPERITPDAPEDVVKSVWEPTRG